MIPPDHVVDRSDWPARYLRLIQLPWYLFNGFVLRPLRDDGIDRDVAIYGKAGFSEWPSSTNGLRATST
jgi:hypothetical protein